MEQPESNCPLADIEKLVPDSDTLLVCPFHGTRHTNLKSPGVTTKKKKACETGNLLKSIGGGDKIHQMATRFYAHLFRDQTIRQFIFEKDCAAAHGKRFAYWVIEQMGGEGTPWTDSGRFGLRQYSHYRAWNSHKRLKQDRGKPFKLTDCRIWMRLIFWSMREVGLEKHSAFASWFVAVIERFISIYELSSPAFTMKDFEWSEKQRNIDLYVNNGFLMTDIAVE